MEGRQGEEEAVSSTYRQLNSHRDKYKEEVCFYVCTRACVCVRVSPDDLPCQLE